MEYRLSTQKIDEVLHLASFDPVAECYVPVKDFHGCPDCQSSFGQFDDETGTVVDCTRCRLEAESDQAERENY